MHTMNSHFYPLTVHASCGHSMSVTSKEQQDAFEKDHRERCGATEFPEQVDEVRL
jgi:hypothetical protein